MSPREPQSWPCETCRGRIYSDQDHYWCTANGCDHQDLCVGCIYQCDDCGCDFCLTHTVQARLTGRFAEIRCVACHVVRTALAETTATLPTLELMPLAA